MLKSALQIVCTSSTRLFFSSNVGWISKIWVSHTAVALRGLSFMAPSKHHCHFFTPLVFCISPLKHSFVSGTVLTVHVYKRLCMCVCVYASDKPLRSSPLTRLRKTPNSCPVLSLNLCVCVFSVWGGSEQGGRIVTFSRSRISEMRLCNGMRGLSVMGKWTRIIFGDGLWQSILRWLRVNWIKSSYL